MLKKNYSKTGRSCRVTFKVDDINGDSVAVLGEWNSWDESSNPLKKRKDGTFSTTVSLEAGRDYRFRYLVDGEHWINEVESDSEVVNNFGTTDCVVAV